MNKSSFLSGEMLLRQLNRKLHPQINPLLKYQTRLLPAIDFIEPERLDLIAKYCLVNAWANGLDDIFAIELYLSSIQPINGFVENDGSGKNGQIAFVERFRSLFEGIRANGYDADKPVPISNGHILDGAHRIAICLVLGIDVPCIELGYKPHLFDFSFYTENFYNKDLLDYLVLSYAKIRKNSRVVIVWGAAHDKDDELQTLIQSHCKIVCLSSFEFTAIGKSNFVRLAYQGEPWLGNLDDGFSGAQYKSEMCFGGSNKIRVYLVEMQEDLIPLKDLIRNLYSIGKHSVHINDTHQETKILCQTLFNRNSMHWINNSRSGDFPKFRQLLPNYKAAIDEQSFVNSDLWCIDGGSVLAAYGVRDVGDFDYLTIDAIGWKTQIFDAEIECQNKKHIEFGCGVAQTILDPRHHFYCNDLKFISLVHLIQKKKLRASVSDFDDIERVKSFFSTELIEWQRNLWFKKITSWRYLKGRIKGVLLMLKAKTTFRIK